MADHSREEIEGFSSTGGKLVLIGKDLSGLKFDVAELHEAVLERTILNEVYLANTMLKYANLKG
jgi:uncharacterized protein YjbI with pentapeptide repeats